MRIKTPQTANTSVNPMSLSEESFIAVLCTCPDSGTAETLAETLLQEKVIACANLIPALESLYWWEGKIQKDREILLILKTARKFFNRVEMLIKKKHPYQVPEIIALPILEGSAPYLSWISDSLGDSHV